MNIILGDGLLGKEIQNQTNWYIFSRNRNNIDFNYFTDWSSLLDDYDTIINCIAYTKTYDNNYQNNWKINVVALDQLIDYCNMKKKKLVHISTDYIYAGSCENASELDVPVHINTWYGYTKLVGDAIVQLKSKNYLLCRLSHKPNPFPYEMAWSDLKTNCDSVDVISSLIVSLIEKNAVGIFNVGTEVKTISELAKKSNPLVKSIPKPSNVPNDVTMNIDKLKNFLNNSK